MRYSLFPAATIVVFNDGSRAACDTNGEMLVEFLRRVSANDTNISIPVKYGRAVINRPITDVNIAATFAALHATARASDPPLPFYPPPPLVEA